MNIKKTIGLFAIAIAAASSINASSAQAEELQLKKTYRVQVEILDLVTGERSWMTIATYEDAVAAEAVSDLMTVFMDAGFAETFLQLDDRYRVINVRVICKISPPFNIQMMSQNLQMITGQGN